jgi:hypothetical protein
MEEFCFSPTNCWPSRLFSVFSFSGCADVTCNLQVLDTLLFLGEEAEPEMDSLHMASDIFRTLPVSAAFCNCAGSDIMPPRFLSLKRVDNEASMDCDVRLPTQD